MDIPHHLSEFYFKHLVDIDHLLCDYCGYAYTYACSYPQLEISFRYFWLNICDSNRLWMSCDHCVAQSSLTRPWQLVTNVVKCQWSECQHVATQILCGQVSGQEFRCCDDREHQSWAQSQISPEQLVYVRNCDYHTEIGYYIKLIS